MWTDLILSPPEGPCDAGYYGSAESVRTTSTCTGICDAGHYGKTSGLSISTCTGPFEEIGDLWSLVYSMIAMGWSEKQWAE